MGRLWLKMILNEEWHENQDTLLEKNAKGSVLLQCMPMNGGDQKNLIQETPLWGKTEKVALNRVKVI
jgi:hypothetical protein